MQTTLIQKAMPGTTLLRNIESYPFQQEPDESNWTRPEFDFRVPEHRHDDTQLVQPDALASCSVPFHARMFQASEQRERFFGNEPTGFYGSRAFSPC